MMHLENRQVIGDYYPASARISDEDRVTCEACGAHHHMDDKGSTFFVTCFGPQCRDCRIWCDGCGDELVEATGSICAACAEESRAA
jgi:hypothetical protein